MRGTILALGLMAAVGGSLGRGEGVSYSGRLSHSGANADGQLFVAGPDWDLPYLDATLGWTVDNVTTPGQWHYVYTLEVPGGERRAAIQCVIVETTESRDSQAFTASDVSAPARVPEGWLTALQVGLFTAGSEPDLPRDFYGVEFSMLAKGSTTLTISFDSDRGPKWGDLYAHSFMVRDVSNVLYNAGLLSLNPAEVPHSGSVDGHILVPDTIAPVFLIPVPGAAFLGVMGIYGIGWLRRHKWL